MKRDVCFTNICEHLDYANTDIINIEKEKRGQHEYPNWHLMRRGLITTSKVKGICKSTNYTATADSLISINSLLLDFDRHQSVQIPPPKRFEHIWWICLILFTSGCS